MAQDNNKLIPVFIDNGYNDFKIAWLEKGEIKTKIIPTLVGQGRQNVSWDQSCGGVFEVEGTEYTISQYVSEPIKDRSAGYAVSEANLAMVMNALISIGLAGKEISLTTGLPFDNYYIDGEPNVSWIKKIQESFQRTVVCLQGSVETPKIVEHHVRPESLCAFVAYVSEQNEDGQWEMAKRTKPVGIIDMGGQTTDITVVNPDMTIASPKSGTVNLGVYDLTGMLRQQFSSKFDLMDIAEQQLRDALKKKVFTYMMQDQDVSKEVKEANLKMAKKVSNAIDTKIGPNDLGEFVFAGGGALAIGEEMKSIRLGVTVPEDAQLLNVLGMAILYLISLEG